MSRDTLEDRIKADLMDGESAAGLFSRTWSSKTGRCTSLALKVSHNLASDRPDGTYSFHTYDMGKHRLSRCQNTFIVIDSSSNRGAIVVPPGDEWTTFFDADLKWRWAEGVSSTTRQVTGSTSRPPHIRMGKSHISDVQAMARCLSEVAADAVLITLFRSIENSLPQFHGLVKWVLDDPKEKVDSKEKRKYLYLQPDLHNRDRFFCIEWRKGGTSDTSDSCYQFLVDFVVKYGGPHGRVQWKADDGDMIHQLVWNSVCECYGYPILEKYGTPE